jgi:hypothetical protein
MSISDLGGKNHLVRQLVSLQMIRLERKLNKDELPFSCRLLNTAAIAHISDIFNLDIFEFSLAFRYLNPTGPFFSLCYSIPTGTFAISFWIAIGLQVFHR